MMFQVFHLSFSNHRLNIKAKQAKGDSVPKTDPV